MDVLCLDRKSDLFPHRLIEDPEPPRQLFAAGCVDVNAWPTVAIVGSRFCTNYGRRVAEDLGYQLARAGVCVVSGLAKGIDGAAHAGVMRAWNEAPNVAPPVAVVGGGVDVVYPKENASLWQQVCEFGMVVSEYRPGTTCEAWRFPQRNRIIAALGDVIVVVESTHKSGTRHTVEAALARGKHVMAVPGPITSAQSEGTNELLREGAAPLCEVDDVLFALGLSPIAPAIDPAIVVPNSPVAEVLETLPQSLEELARITALAVGELARELYVLEAAGFARQTREGWERTR